jgi:hypothetical protein
MGAQGSLLCEQMLEDVGFENVQAEDQTMQVTCSQVYLYKRKQNSGLYERQHPNDFWVCSLYEYAYGK